MGLNFSINPDFENNFNNSINEYNKSFSNSLNNTNINPVEQSEFDKIFNEISTSKQIPLQGGAQYFIGMDAINAQKIDNYNISDTARMAKDIQNGFSNGINSLNQVERKAEEDFETFASGGDISVHDVMISAQKSTLAMQMAIQLRNQMITAYNEFKNMQF